MLSLQSVHCFIICLLRHCSVLVFSCFLLGLCLLCHYTISSWIPLFYYLLVTCRHFSVLGFDCSIFCLLRHYRPTIAQSGRRYRLSDKNVIPWKIKCCRRNTLPLPGYGPVSDIHV